MRAEQIDNHEYQIGKLGVFDQLHVGRKLAPLLAHVMPAFARLMESGSDPSLGLLLVEGGAIPIADVLSRMSEEDVDFVVNKCLEVCKRKDKAWVKIISGPRSLMFIDIELDTVIKLVQFVVEDSFERFFHTGQSESKPAE